MTSDLEGFQAELKKAGPLDMRAYGLGGINRLYNHMLQGGIEDPAKYLSENPELRDFLAMKDGMKQPGALLDKIDEHIRRVSPGALNATSQIREQPTQPLKQAFDYSREPEFHTFSNVMAQDCKIGYGIGFHLLYNQIRDLGYESPLKFVLHENNTLLLENLKAGQDKFELHELKDQIVAAHEGLQDKGVTIWDVDASELKLPESYQECPSAPSTKFRGLAPG